MQSLRRDITEAKEIVAEGERWFALSRDNRLIYFSVAVTEADIWLATLERG